MAVNSKLIILSLVVLAAGSFAGCGENKHVTGSDPAAVESSGAAAPAGEVAAVEEPKAVETPEPKVVIEEPKVVVEEPKVVQVVAQKGDDGKDGQNGKDGRDSCIKVDNIEKATIVPLTPIQLKEYRSSRYKGLPYLPLEPSHVTYGDDGKIKKVAKGAKSVGLVTINGANAPENKSTKTYINNAMVVFDMELRLPPKKTLILNRAFIPNLTIQAFKQSVDDITDTESLCLVGVTDINSGEFTQMKICSGQAFHTEADLLAASRNGKLSSSQKELARWGTLIQEDFGGEYYVNKFFSDNLSAAISGRKGKWEDSLVLNMIDLTSTQGKRMTPEEFVDILYGNTPDDKDFAKRLRFVVSDDTLVRTNGTGLEVKFSFDACSLDPNNQKKQKDEQEPVAPAPAPAKEPAPAPAPAPTGSNTNSVDPIGGEGKGAEAPMPSPQPQTMPVVQDTDTVSDDGGSIDQGSSDDITDDEFNF